MNFYLIMASVVTIFVGLTHSFLGEKLIFSKLRLGNLVPTCVAPPLKERHIRIIWATWHMASFFGFGFAVLLYWLAFPSTNIEIETSFKLAIAVTMFLSALLVAGATKGKHPGWVGLSLVGLFICLS